MAEPEIDMHYADIAFLEVDGSTATKVKAAVWAWVHLTTLEMSLNQVRAWLVSQGFQVVDRG